MSRDWQGEMDKGACVRVCARACIDHLTKEGAWQEFISLV